MERHPRRTRVTPVLSIVLDIVRLGLSLVVAGGHWTQPYFQEGWSNRTSYAVGAVGGFFVLSGFTIRMIYPSREQFALRQYMAERFSRILSVTIPALSATLLLDALALYVNPDYYTANWGGQSSNPVFRVLVNLFGLSQIWGLDVSPLSNSPFWSISYELGFYLVFGLWFAGRHAWAVGTLILLGPNIAFMFLFWLSGALLFDMCCGVNAERRLTPAGVLLLAAGSLAFSVTIYRFGGPVIAAMFAAIHVRPVSHVLAASAVSFFGVFAIAARVAHRLPEVRVPAAVVSSARRLGNMTFPLYLFHFPLFVVMGAVGFYDRTSSAQKVAVFVIVVALTALVSPLAARFKVALRAVMSGAKAERVSTEASGA